MENIKPDKLWVSKKGECVDTDGHQQKLSRTISEILKIMRVGERVMIYDVETSKF